MPVLEPFAQGNSFRRRMLHGMALHLYRRPFLSIAFLLVLTVAAGWKASGLEVARNLRAFVPPAPAEQAPWEGADSVVRPHAPVTAVVLLRTPNPPDAATRRTLIATYLAAWSDPNLVASIEYVPVEAAPASRPGPSARQMLLSLRPEDLREVGEASRAAGGTARLEKTLSERLSSGTGRGTRPTSATLAAVGADPFGLVAALRDRASDAPGTFPTSLPHAHYLEPDPRQLVFVLAPARPSSDFFYCLNLRRFLESTDRVLQDRAQNPVPQAKLRLYGRHIDTARTADSFRADMLRTVIVVFFCSLLLVVLAFRKIESCLFVLLPPCLGLVWTYGLTACFTTEISLLSAVFPLLFLALGFEFVVQIHHRFIEELYREQRYYPALGTAYGEAGRGIIVSTLATALIFFPLQWSHFENLRELALVGGAGTLCMSLSALLVLPPLAAVKSRLAGGRVRPLEMYGFGLKDLGAMVAASPRTTLALGLLLTVYLAFYARQTRFDREVGLDMGAPQTLSERKFPKRFPDPELVENPLSILVESRSLQEALGRNDRLYTNLVQIAENRNIGAIRSLSPVLPSLPLQDAVRQELERTNPEALAARLAAAAQRLGLPPGIFAPWTQTLRDLRSAARATRPVQPGPGLPPAAAAAAQSLVIHSPGPPGDGMYRVVTTIFPEKTSPLFRDRGFDRFAEEAGAGLPAGALRFRSDFLQNRQVAETVIYNMALLVFLSLLSLLVCLLPHFKSRPSDALLALLPLVCAVIWTLGLLTIFQDRIGLYALLTLPLIIGLSINESILLIQRMHDRQYASVRQVVRTGGRPGLVTAFALLLGLGSLLAVRFQPLAEMASVLLCAVAAYTLCNLVFVPALLEIRRQGGLWGWENDEED